MSNTPILENGKTLKDASVAKEVLPTQQGFFFGSTDYDQYYYDDLAYTRDTLEKVLAEPGDVVPAAHRGGHGRQPPLPQQSQPTMHYTVLSPDGFPIACDAIYPSVADAQQALATWCERYRAQGYYRDARWKKIALARLPLDCQIVIVV